MRDEAPKVLKNAINLTAKQARKELAREAKKAYTVKIGGFERAMRLKAASTGNPEAVIRATGAPIPLIKFRHKEEDGQVKVQVVRPGRLKPLEKNGIKSFINNIAEKKQKRKKDTDKGRAGANVKHNAIAERLTKKRLKIKELDSVSIPVMIGNENRAYGIVEPHIQENLQRNIERQVRKVLGG